MKLRYVLKRPGIANRVISRLFGVNVVVSAMAFITSVMIARSLMPDERGELANVLLWPSLIAHLSLLGVHIHLSRMTAVSPEDACRNYRSGVFLILSICAIASSAYLAILSETEFREAKCKDYYRLILSGALIPFSAWNAFQLQMALGQSNFWAYNYVRLSFSVSYFGFAAAVCVLSETSSVAYLGAYLSAAIFSACSAHFVIHKGIRTRTSSIFCGLSFYLSVVRRSLPYALSIALITLASSADKILVSLLFEARSMGIYVVALALSQVQSVVNEAISPVFFSKVAADASGIKGINSDWLALRLRQSVFINAIIGLSIIIIAPFLVRVLYGNEYRDTVSLVMLLVPAIATRTMARSFEEVLKGGNRPYSQSFALISMTTVFGLLASFLRWLGNCGSPEKAEALLKLYEFGSDLREILISLCPRCLAAFIPTLSAMINQTEGAFCSGLNWLGGLHGVALALLCASVCGFYLMARPVARESRKELIDLVLPRPRDVVALIREISPRVGKVPHGG